MPTPETPPARTLPRLALPALRLAIAAALVAFGSPPLALLAGLALALLLRRPLEPALAKASRPLLQACVVLLGFGMSLPVVLRAGLHGALFAAVSIVATLALGLWLGARFGLGRRAALLIASGTAICGGSAIAAVSSVIGATEAEIAVSIGTVFLLNAAGLVAFPALGHALHLAQAPFGLWAGVAIHDISSVVGAGMSYGSEALQVATAVKLSRTLWIAPLTLAIAWRARGAGGARAKIAVPWFIGLFLLASLLRSGVPAIAAHAGLASELARRGMVLVLYLIGSTLSPRALRDVGWRAVTAGLVLWLVVAAGSLGAILLGVPAR